MDAEAVGRAGGEDPSKGSWGHELGGRAGCSLRLKLHSSVSEGRSELVQVEWRVHLCQPIWRRLTAAVGARQPHVQRRPTTMPVPV